MIRRRILIFVVALAACAPRPANTPGPATAKFFADGSVLYREDASGRKAVLALDSATAPAGTAIVPKQWTPAPGSTFGVAAKSFRHIVPSPKLQLVAWETAGGVHDLLGLVPATGGKLMVLDFYFDSSADSLKWSADGHSLNAFYMPPSGTAEVRVYDALSGKRIK